MAQIVELPRLVWWATASNGILVDENLDSPDIPGKVTGILVGPGQLRWRDLRVMTRGFR